MPIPSIPSTSLQANILLAKHPWILEAAGVPMLFQSEEAAVQMRNELQTPDSPPMTIAYRPYTPKSTLQPTPNQIDWATGIRDWMNANPPRYQIGEQIWLSQDDVLASSSDEPEFPALNYSASIVGLSCAFCPEEDEDGLLHRGWLYHVAPLLETLDGFEWDEFWLPEWKILVQ